MSELTKKSLTEITNLIKKKEIKSEELTQSFIKNIEKDKKLNSFFLIRFAISVKLFFVNSDIIQ